jgi:ubiquinol-cytochrome c reductase cytochrome b subunit
VFRKSHPILKLLRSTLVDLPTPSNISFNWNYGSLLGFMLCIQLLRGILLATRFTAHEDFSFDAVILLGQNTFYGWLIRLVHSTGATFFFLFLYLHIGRGLYYGSYVNSIVWNLGVIIYLVSMGTAFLGYVLPWGQISYWGATVITNLVSAIPFLGNPLVLWVWGGFSVANPTLLRFFALHYLLPFVISFLVVLHLFFLHLDGSTNPLGVCSNTNKVTFHYYFSTKDLFFFLLALFFFLLALLGRGYSLIDAQNWIPASSAVTPEHIQPEWYFLFAYAILRSIPNKLGGVLALLFSVLVLFLFSLFTKNIVFRRARFSPLFRFLFWSLVFVFLLLTWLGSCPAEPPYTGVSLFLTLLYFFLFFLFWSLPVLFNFFYCSSQNH